MRTLGLRDPRWATAREAVGRLTAVQAQEHRMARWSVAQRVQGTARATDIDTAFDRGDFLRTHVLRPTWHYVTSDDLRWLMRFSGPRVHARNSRRYEELGLDGRTLATATDVIAEAVAAAPRTRRELAATLQRRGVSTEGQRLTYMVMHAELHLAVSSGPMSGKQHTYAAFDDRASGDGPDGDEALAELARRYFTTRGPATIKDFAWWAGLPAADARRGLDLAAGYLEHRVVDGRTYAFVTAATPATARRVDLIQCYDEAIISYSQTRDLLCSADVSFDTPRRIDGFTHVVLLDGQLLGHWRLPRAQRGSVLETRLATDVAPATAKALAAAAEGTHRFFSA